ncbi:MAG: prefoldin subunit beta [Thermoplasmata archaeon]|nr:prefoldin subunit beta [Thermoplasmata archaeon]
MVRFDELPPQVQNQLQQLQQLQQQFEMVVQQRLQIDVKMRENQTAIEEINKAEEGIPIYKTIGNLIISAKKDEIIKELQEEQESLDVRKKALEAQEKRLKEKIDELQNKIQEALGEK